MPKRWRIEGYDGDRKFLQNTIGYDGVRESDIVAMLQRLTSKHLSDAEVIDASLPKGMVGHSSSLEPQIDRSGRLTIMVGSNPWGSISSITISSAFTKALGQPQRWPLP